MAPTPAPIVAPLPSESGLPGVVRELSSILGRNLTAYIGGAGDVRTVDAWMDGAPAEGEASERLRVGLQVGAMLAQWDDRNVIHAWFTGLNPDLEGRSPIRFLREENPEKAGSRLTLAARTFIARG